MLNILFNDSGYLKYPPGDTQYNYLYAINTTDYPTLHRHVDYWEFCIVTEGALKNCVVGQKTELCEKNTLHFMSTSDQHRLLKASKQVRYINISVRETHLLQILNFISPHFRERLLQGPRLFSLSDTLVSGVENLLHECNLLSSEQVEEKNGLLCSALLLILQELNRIHLNVPKHFSPFMMHLLSLTEQKEFLRYTAKDLGDALNYSPAHLNRLFKEHFQLTPYEYLQNHKFQYAHNLLQNTGIGISEIAAEIGYSNLSHFFSNFKKRYGMTPGECRKRPLQEHI